MVIFLAKIKLRNDTELLKFYSRSEGLIYSARFGPGFGDGNAKKKKKKKK